MTRKYNIGDVFVGPYNMVTITGTEKQGHTTSLSLKIKYGCDGSFETRESNAHRMTILIKRWGLVKIEK